MKAVVLAHVASPPAFISTVDKDLWVDLQREIGVGPGAQAFSAESLLERAQTVQLLGRDILGPTPIDLLLMTWVAGTRDGWNRVQGLLALAVQVRAFPAAAWPQVMAAARAAGCARRVTVGVMHVCRMLGMTPPAAVADYLAHDSTARRLLASLTPDSLLRVPVPGRRRQLAKLRWRIASSDSAGAAAAHVVVRAFRPGPEDWRLVSLPAGLDWLCWVIRPPRLALKWARLR